MFSFFKPYDVIFYYPQHFNRGRNNTNPYFDPLVEVCEKNGLHFKVIEEPDKGTKIKKNKNAYDFTFWTLLIQVFRKIIPQFIFKTFREKECFIGSCLSILSFNSFKAKNYITISNAKVNFLTGLNKEARVIDLQHGIIYSSHFGYFHNDGSVLDELTEERIFFMVYGKSYAKMFFKNGGNSKYNIENRVKVVGDLLNTNYPNNVEKKLNVILFSLQFTDDIKIEEAIQKKNNLMCFLEESSNFFLKNNLVLLLKNHPRFNDIIDLSEIEKKFQFTKFTEKNLDELSAIVFLHITENSTVTFDLAKFGIPTYFNNLKADKSVKNIFYEEYDYPLKYNTLSEMMETYFNEEKIYIKDSQEIKKWTNNFYEPFKKEQFIEILKL